MPCNRTQADYNSVSGHYVIFMSTVRIFATVSQAFPCLRERAPVRCSREPRPGVAAELVFKIKGSPAVLSTAVRG